MCALNGADSNRGQQIRLDERLLSQHLLFLGAIGTGKTNAISQIVSQLSKNITNSDVMIIFDAKGDYIADRSICKHGFDVVISNDEKAVGEDGRQNFWNIFGEISRGAHMEDDVREISRTLFHEMMEKTTQLFFPAAASDLFAAVLLHCCRQSGKSYANADLRQYLNWAGVADLQSMLASHADLNAMRSYISGIDSPQSLGVLSELQQMTRQIFTGNFAKQGSLSIRSLVRAKGGRKIFIEYDLGIGNALAPIYSLLFDLAIKEALCRREGERGNVYFVCDELKLVPHLQHMDDAVNFGRSLGVKFIVGIQNVMQIYEAYAGKGADNSLAKSILSGFSTKVSYRVSDSESRDYIKGLYGVNRRLETYSHARGGTIAENPRDGDVIEDRDITQLPVGRAIVCMPGAEPFLFSFERYGKG
jgi:type IV secretory pathway TraG/TraD family ATPase VirD4